jgi:hypothetical protein
MSRKKLCFWPTAGIIFVILCRPDDLKDASANSIKYLHDIAGLKANLKILRIKPSQWRSRSNSATQITASEIDLGKEGNGLSQSQEDSKLLSRS